MKNKRFGGFITFAVAAVLANAFYYLIAIRPSSEPDDYDVSLLIYFLAALISSAGIAAITPRHARLLALGFLSTIIFALLADPEDGSSRSTAATGLAVLAPFEFGIASAVYLVRASIARRDPFQRTVDPFDVLALALLQNGFIGSAPLEWRKDGTTVSAVLQKDEPLLRIRLGDEAAPVELSGRELVSLLSRGEASNIGTIAGQIVYLSAHVSDLVAASTDPTFLDRADRIQRSERN